MYINKFRILNYKSYRDSGAVEFRKGFNVITGKNNTGKTALLEALSLRFSGRPHSTVETVRYPGDRPPNTSTAHFTLVLDKGELLRCYGEEQRYLPAPQINFSWTGGSYDGSPKSGFEFVTWLLDRDEFQLDVQIQSVDGAAPMLWRPAGPLAFGLYPRAEDQANPSTPPHLVLKIGSNGQPLPPSKTHADRANDVSVFLAQTLASQIYRFTAERFNMGQSTFGHNTTLTPNAQNLPEVLNALQANSARFQRFNDLVQKILPQTRHVSVRPLAGNQVQIVLWPHDPDSMREDVVVPLSESGSGVGQILAILYVVMTSAFPQTIIVDEPQSFLHPGAVRKLLEILREYPQHQYILATHSPTVITASDPQVLVTTRLVDGKSSLISLSTSDNKDLQYTLNDVGASLSDVFGADRILWVEGSTERECFPLILREILQQQLLGIAVVAIRDTGDLEGRDARRVFQLYNRLSTANALLPPSVGFILDEECRSDLQKEELRKLSQGLLEFLPRRMYENYLLDSPTIAQLMNEISGFRPERSVSAEEVEAILNEKRQQLDLYCSSAKQIPEDWVRTVDGAKLLSEMFSELSESRVSYQKTLHSVGLTKLLIRNSPEKLRGVAELLDRVLKD